MCRDSFKGYHLGETGLELRRLEMLLTKVKRVRERKWEVIGCWDGLGFGFRRKSKWVRRIRQGLDVFGIVRMELRKS